MFNVVKCAILSLLALITSELLAIKTNKFFGSKTANGPYITCKISNFQSLITERLCDKFALKVSEIAYYQKPIKVETCNGPLCARKQASEIRFAKYHIWNNKSEGFPNMVLSTETFNQSVRTEYSEAVNARYTFQPLWVSVIMQWTFNIQ